MPPSIVDAVSYAGGMTSDSDDALSWDGDESVSPPERATRARSAQQSEPPSSPQRRPASDAPVVDDERAPLSTGILLTLGIVGGIYLLYSVGWVVGGLRLKPLANLIVADAMYVPWFILAVAAPALWFLASWVLTRSKAAWIRIALLVVGVVLLVPWPFVTVGVVGS